MLRRRDYVKKEILDRPVYQPKKPIFKPGKPDIVDKKVPRKIRDRISEGQSNIDLMKDGKAPIGTDGLQVNLHHLFGTEPGPMVEMLKSVHQNNHKILHDFIEKSFRRNTLLEDAYDKFRKKYWKARANDF